MQRKHFLRNAISGFLGLALPVAAVATEKKERKPEYTLTLDIPDNEIVFRRVFVLSKGQKIKLGNNARLEQCYIEMAEDHDSNWLSTKQYGNIINNYIVFPKSSSAVFTKHLKHNHMSFRNYK